MDAALEVTGLWPIRDYVRRWQEKIMDYVAWRIIYKPFICAENMEGPSRFLRWWEQEHAPTQAER